VVRKNRLVVGALVLVVAAVVALVVARYFVLQSRPSATNSPQATSTDVPAPTTTVPTRQSAPAVVPGWHTVVDDSHDLHYTGVELAYDVPADWRVSTIGESLSVAGAPIVSDSFAYNGAWRLDMSMLADNLAGFCPAPLTLAVPVPTAVTAPEMAGVGLVTRANGPTDDRAAAEEIAQHVAMFAYGPAGRGAGGPPSITIGSSGQITVHGVTGYQVTARVTTDQPGRCGPAGGLLDVLALPGPGYGDSTMVVAFSDQQFSGAVSGSVLDRIVTSFRQLPPH
jgi:hypothetical protein